MGKNVKITLVVWSIPNIPHVLSIRPRKQVGSCRLRSEMGWTRTGDKAYDYNRVFDRS